MDKYCQEDRMFFLITKSMQQGAGKLYRQTLPLNKLKTGISTHSTLFMADSLETGRSILALRIKLSKSEIGFVLLNRVGTHLRQDFDEARGGQPIPKFGFVFSANLVFGVNIKIFGFVLHFSIPSETLGLCLGSFRIFMVVGSIWLCFFDDL
jgi:hypothetical protein